MCPFLSMVLVVTLFPASTPEDAPRIYQGKTIRQWVEALSAKDPSLRRQAAEALAKLKPRDRRRARVQTFVAKPAERQSEPLAA